MRRAVVNASLVLLAIGLHAAEPDYSRDVTKWQEVAVPPESDTAFTSSRAWHTLSLLLPAKQFLHKLPKEVEDRIRKQYGD